MAGGGLLPEPRARGIRGRVARARAWPRSAARARTTRRAGLLRGGASPRRSRPSPCAWRAPTGARVTLIAADGRVARASPSARAGDLAAHREPRGSGPEVRDGARGPTRSRPAARARTHRRAAPLRRAAGASTTGSVIGVLRLALPLSAVTASYATLHQVMLAGGAGGAAGGARHRHLRGRPRDAPGGRDAVHRPPDERGQFRWSARPSRSHRRDRHARPVAQRAGGAAAREDPGPRAGAGQGHRDPRRHGGGRPSRWTATSTSC